MNNFGKFTFGKDAIVEEMDGRTHFWHYSPEVTKDAEIIMVKVSMPVKGKHDFHRHPEMHEILYILSGQAEVWIEDEKHILTSGDSIYIDKNIVHATFNVGKDTVEFLAILSPSSGWEDGTIDEYMNLPYSTYKKQTYSL